MKTKMVIKKASMGGTSSGYTPSTAQNSNKVSCDAYSQNGGQIMQKGKSKLEKQKNGGMVKKMAVGGTTTKRIIKKSTGGMYGIPQENLGTSSQYGFAKKGGVIKKYAKGGTKPPCPPGYHMEGSDCVKDQKAFDSLGAKLGFFGPLAGGLGLGAKILVDRNKNKIPRLKEREANLVSRGKKAVDEGRNKKDNRFLGRAAKVENRIITLEEKKKKKK